MLLYGHGLFICRTVCVKTDFFIDHEELEYANASGFDHQLRLRTFTA